MSSLFIFTSSFLGAANGPVKMVFAMRQEGLHSSPSCQPRPSNKKLIPIKVLSHLKRAEEPILDHTGEKYLIFPIVKKEREARF